MADASKAAEDAKPADGADSAASNEPPPTFMMLSNPARVLLEQAAVVEIAEGRYVKQPVLARHSPALALLLLFALALAFRVTVLEWLFTLARLAQYTVCVHPTCCIIWTSIPPPPPTHTHTTHTHCRPHQVHS
jgi:hypothetical protein